MTAWLGRELPLAEKLRLLSQIRVPMNGTWQPLRLSPYQLPIFARIHPTTRRLSNKLCVTGGIQSGKSMVVAALCLMTSLTKDLVYLVGPDYDQCRFEMQYLADWLAQLDALEEFTNPKGDTWLIRTTTGCEIRTFSAKNPPKIAGASPDLLCIVEAGQCLEEAFRICEARVVAKGAPLVVSGTLEDLGYWYEDLVEAISEGKRPDWALYELPSWANPRDYPLGADDPKVAEARRTLPTKTFLERLAGKRQPRQGRVFPEYDPSLHSRPIRFGAPHPLDDPRTLYLPEDQRLELWVDPAGFGKSAYAVAIVAVVGQCVYQVAEIYETGEVYTKDVIALARQQDWWPRVGAVIIDTAGSQHQGPSSNAEIWEAPFDEGGADLPVRWNKVDLYDGNNRIRDLLHADQRHGRARYAHDPCCVKTRWEFTQGYRYPTDALGKPTSKIPRDQDNHLIATLRYGFYDHYSATGEDYGGYGVHARKIPDYGRGRDPRRGRLRRVS